MKRKLLRLSIEEEIVLTGRLFQTKGPVDQCVSCSERSSIVDFQKLSEEPVDFSLRLREAIDDSKLIGTNKRPEFCI